MANRRWRCKDGKIVRGEVEMSRRVVGESRRWRKRFLVDRRKGSGLLVCRKSRQKQQRRCPKYHLPILRSWVKNPIHYWRQDSRFYFLSGYSSFRFHMNVQRFLFKANEKWDTACDDLTSLKYRQKCLALCLKGFSPTCFTSVHTCKITKAVGTAL